MTSLSEIPSLRLTTLTDCGGCAAKLGADLLSEALSGLGAQAAPDELIAGLQPPDDAAAYRVSNDLAIIGTVDFFPPLVDDARTFGQIAAANAMSDVFAMGGRVLFALSIAAFPEDLPPDVLAEVFDGASEMVRSAGGTLAGGHTIRDPEPKYGLAVIGAAHPDRLLRKGGAQPGDSLVLTKRLGTGLLVSGARQGRTGSDDLATAIESMRALDRSAAEIFVANGIRATTDITGFGLLGHWLEHRGFAWSSRQTRYPRCPAPSIWPGPASRRAAQRTIAASCATSWSSTMRSTRTLSPSPMILRRAADCWRPCLSVRSMRSSTTSMRPAGQPGVSVMWRPAAASSSDSRGYVRTAAGASTPRRRSRSARSGRSARSA